MKLVGLTDAALTLVIPKGSYSQVLAIQNRAAATSPAYFNLDGETLTLALTQDEGYELVEGDTIVLNDGKSPFVTQGIYGCLQSGAAGMDVFVVGIANA